MYTPHKLPAKHVKPEQGVKMVFTYKYVITLINLLWDMHQEYEKIAYVKNVIACAPSADPLELKHMLENFDYPLKDYPADRLKQDHEDIYRMFMNLARSLEYEE